MARLADPTISAEQAARIDELNALMLQQWHSLCAGQAALLASISEYAALGGPRHDNTANVAATLICLFGCSGATARGLAAQAGVIATPGVAEALAAGTVTPDHVRTLASRGATPENLEQAQAMDADDLAACLRRSTQPSDDDATDARDRRRCTMRRLPDGDLSGSFRLPALDGDTVRTALERLAAQQPLNPATGLYDPLHKQLADALVDACSAVLSDDADADRATVTVSVNQGFDTATLPDGTRLAPAIVDRLLCDCRLEAEIISEPGEPVRFSMVRRHPSPAQTRALRRRQRGACGWPGCHRRHFLHAHHLIHWSRGGPTILRNLVLLCRYHHALVHEGGWTTSGTADDWAIYKPDGRRWRPPWQGLTIDDSDQPLRFDLHA